MRRFALVARSALAGTLALLSLACGDTQLPSVPARDGGRTSRADAATLIEPVPVSGRRSPTDPRQRDGGSGDDDDPRLRDGGVCTGGGSALPQCGTVCPAGSHPRAFLCDTECGTSCITSNAVQCEEDCGDSFVTCNTFCPAGYRRMDARCDVLCGEDCTTSNSFTCVQDPASFE